MCSRPDGPPAHLLIVMCALAFVLQAVAPTAVDLPGCGSLGRTGDGPHAHSADDHPEGDRGLLALPAISSHGFVLTGPQGMRPQPGDSSIPPLLQPPRSA